MTAAAPSPEPDPAVIERMARALTEHAYAQRGMILTDAEWGAMREGCMAGMLAAYRAEHRKGGNDG